MRMFVFRRGWDQDKDPPRICRLEPLPLLPSSLLVPRAPTCIAWRTHCRYSVTNVGGSSCTFVLQVRSRVTKFRARCPHFSGTWQTDAPHRHTQRCFRSSNTPARRQWHDDDWPDFIWNRSQLRFLCYSPVLATPLPAPFTVRAAGFYP